MECIINDFEIYHKTNKDNIRLVNHHHSTHEIIFVRKGKSDFLIDGKKYSLKQNCLLFIANFEKHMHSSYETPYERYYMLLSNNMLDSNLLDQRLLSILRNRPAEYCHMAELTESEAEQAEMLFKELIAESNSNSPYRTSLLKLKLTELIIYLFRCSPQNFIDYNNDSYADTIVTIQQYLNKHYSEPLLLKDVAAVHYTDMYYLSTKFKEMVGYSFKQYLTNLRISHAKMMLQNSKHPISKIAVDCGFSESTNFIRVFKKSEGTSPLKYRIESLKDVM